MAGVGSHGIVRLNVGDDVLEQVVLEVLSHAIAKHAKSAAASWPCSARSGVRSAGSTESAASSATSSTTSCFGVGRCIAVGEHDDHRLDLFVGYQIVENHIGPTVLNPRAFILASAVD